MNYQNGKIYTIRSFQTDKVYIGSTCSPLHKRFYQHKNDYKNNKKYYSSYEIIKYEDAYIELLEEYPCNNKMELCKKEGECIRSMDCVNKVIPSITEEERKENKREYDKEYQKEYRKNNKEEILKKKKEYYENNKEEKLKKMKEYKKRNKEKLTEKRKQKIKCVCGSICRKWDIKKHEKTKKHIKYIEEMKV